MTARLRLALDGGLNLPSAGTVAVFNATTDHDLSLLPKDRVLVVQPFFPDFDAFIRQGFVCEPYAPQDASRFAASLIFLPRSRDEAHNLIAQAALRTDGPIVVDGQKTDGIDAILKALRKRADIPEPVVKAHGKLFWCAPDASKLADWRLPDQMRVGVFRTMPGVFSADGIDPGSQLLGDNLPRKLGRRVADLGAGWGYLSTRVLERDDVETLNVVEAHFGALACARRNVEDKRVQFHWADVSAWQDDFKHDCVVMNPPFHSSRSSDPDIGRSFIRAAANVLTSSGHLWMVANRHLAYEAALRGTFAMVEEKGGDNRFKIIHAQRPTRTGR